MNKIFKALIALVTLVFLSLPVNAAPVELHYWHGHTGKLENIINEIANNLYFILHFRKLSENGNRTTKIERSNRNRRKAEIELRK